MGQPLKETIFCGTDVVIISPKIPREKTFIGEYGEYFNFP